MPQHHEFLAFFQDLAALFTHGMRNRLTPAKTGAELLEESVTPSSAKIKAATEHILNSLSGSLQLLDELDALWRIMPSTGKLGNLASFVAEKSKAHQLSASVQSTLDELQFDHQLWGAIVDEVLANVKTHGGGEVQVVCSPIEDKIEIRFQDRGPGLGAMLPERALEATRRSEKSKGAGMGLSKATYAALLLDGTLKLEATSAGLCVIVTAAPTSSYPLLPQ